MSDLAIYLGLIGVGLAGSPHCIGMCGGIVAALGTSGPRPSLILGYNLGRLSSYVLAGLLAGLVGSFANVREVTPLIAATALAAQVGAGFTAEIGAMRVTEQVDALRHVAARGDLHPQHPAHAIEPDDPAVLLRRQLHAPRRRRARSAPGCWWGWVSSGLPPAWVTRESTWPHGSTISESPQVSRPFAWMPL